MAGKHREGCQSKRIKGRRTLGGNREEEARKGEDNRIHSPSYTEAME